MTKICIHLHPKHVHCILHIFICFYIYKTMFLKRHGNEADFLGFLQKLVPHASLTLSFEPFLFWLRIRGDIRILKTAPRYHRYGESAIEFF